MNTPIRVRLDVVAAVVVALGFGGLLVAQQPMVPYSGIAGGANAVRYTSISSNEDKHVVKATPGTLYAIIATNTNAAARYLRCENDTSANTSPGAETPELDLAIPGDTAGSGFVIPMGGVGWKFSTALTCWTVTGAADTDQTEVAANEIKLLYILK